MNRIASSSPAHAGFCRNEQTNAQCKLAIAIFTIGAVGATLLFLGVAFQHGWSDSLVNLQGRIALFAGGTSLLCLSLAMIAYEISKCRLQLDDSAHELEEAGSKITDPLNDLEGVRNVLLLGNKVKVYDCTSKNISVIIIPVLVDDKELDVIGLKQISPGYNGLGEPVSLKASFQIAFDSHDMYREDNKYFVVKDHPTSGVEIFEYKITGRKGSAEKHWHVLDSVQGHYPNYYFPAQRLHP